MRTKSIKSGRRKIANKAFNGKPEGRKGGGIGDHE